MCRESAVHDWSGPELERGVKSILDNSIYIGKKKPTDRLAMQHPRHICTSGCEDWRVR